MRIHSLVQLVAFEMFCFLLSAATKLDCDGIYFFVIIGPLSQSQSTKGMCNTYTE